MVGLSSCQGHLSTVDAELIHDDQDDGIVVKISEGQDSTRWMMVWI